jgi:hypothetical protein
VERGCFSKHAANATTALETEFEDADDSECRFRLHADTTARQGFSFGFEFLTL